MPPAAPPRDEPPAPPLGEPAEPVLDPEPAIESFSRRGELEEAELPLEVFLTTGLVGRGAEALLSPDGLRWRADCWLEKEDARSTLLGSGLAVVEERGEPRAGGLADAGSLLVIFFVTGEPVFEVAVAGVLRSLVLGLRSPEELEVLV